MTSEPASPDNPADIRLGVNVDHVATLRQARGTRYPSVVDAAHRAMGAGASSITVHLREDRRHIQDADVEALIADDDVPVNMEMAVTEPMLDIAVRLRPRDACLVPENRAELTTEGGLDVAGQVERVGEAVARLAAADIRAALFIDPVIEQIDAAITAGVPAIELHTGAYADAPDEASRLTECARLRAAAKHATAAGIEVHGGHGLTRANVGAIAAIGPIVELNIGHSIIADTLIDGLGAAVARMLAAMKAGRHITAE